MKQGVSMGKLLKTVLLLSFLLVSVNFFQGYIPSATGHTPMIAQAAEDQGTNLIQVSGSGEVTVTPDLAILQFGVETTGSSAQLAHQENAKIFAKINETMAGLKVDKKDITTVRFNTYPIYDWSNNKQELKGYRVKQIIQVKYRDITAIGNLLDKVSQAGANRVENIMYTSEKMDEYRMMALEKAMENAKEKADRLAKKAGVSIKGVNRISEGGITPTPIRYEDMSSKLTESAPAASSTQVYPGEMKIEASVNVVYTF